ncbi:MULTISPECIES: hypothetical protein [Paenibacillus]|uniref:hypothetical protein n=1 Tax=Paenibacillus TaxID=44249 RepID=UPI0011654BD3|nr:MULTISPECIES: hypothetical protein [Paenibacillus]AWP25236.1 hypothetical protein B9D94_00715 [Paenibacillus sp. Cedars]MBX4152455.1 hypothetical protein [Paenibacillus lautus]
MIEQRLFNCVLVDEGLIEKVYSDFDFHRFVRICSDQTKHYLTKHGLEKDGKSELTTETGYLHLTSVIPGDPESEVYIWSYPFDGEMRVEDFFNTLGNEIVWLDRGSTDVYVMALNDGKEVERGFIYKVIRDQPGTLEVMDEINDRATSTLETNWSEVKRISAKQYLAISNLYKEAQPDIQRISEITASIL